MKADRDLDHMCRRRSPWPGEVVGLLCGLGLLAPLLAVSAGVSAHLFLWAFHR